MSQFLCALRIIIAGVFTVSSEVAVVIHVDIQYPSEKTVSRHTISFRKDSEVDIMPYIYLILTAR